MLLVSLIPIIAVAVLVYINMSSTRDTVSSNVKESRIQLEQGLENGRTAIEESNVGLNMVSISELMLGQLKIYVTERVSDMAGWAADQRITNTLANGVTREAIDFVEQNTENNPAISRVSVSGLDGYTVIKSDSSILPIVSHKEWWQTASQGALYLGPATQATDKEGVTVQVGLPVADPQSGRVAGVLGATLTIDPAGMAEIWGDKVPQSHVILVDEDYDLVIDSVDTGRHLQSDPYWSRAEQKAIVMLRDEGAESGYVMEGDEVVVFSRWVAGEALADDYQLSMNPDLQWSIMIRMPTSVAFSAFEAINADEILETMEEVEDNVQSDTTEILAFLMLILALVSVAVLVVALWVSRGLTDPILKLHRAVVEVMSGNMDHRVNIQSNDEIGDLSKAFDEMTVAVNTAQGQLQNYSKSLERMVENRTKYLEKEIKERQRAETKLQEAHSDLQEAHEELKSSQEQLLQSAKLAAVGQLVSGVAHEVNNPLMAISGNAEMLLKKTEDEKLRKRLRTIYNETGRAIAIVRNLLSFSRKRDLEKTNVSINEVIDSIAQLRSYDMSLEDIEVETIFAPDLPDVLADFQQMQQVILNLMINAEWAIKARGNGGKVIIRTEREGDMVRVTLEDDGTGIPENIQGRVFEPFFTTKDVGEGTGLGLSICYGIINDHNGQISVESKEGKWTRFTILLPIA